MSDAAVEQQIFITRQLWITLTNKSCWKHNKKKAVCSRRLFFGEWTKREESAPAQTVCSRTLCQFIRIMGNPCHRDFSCFFPVCSGKSATCLNFGENALRIWCVTRIADDTTKQNQLVCTFYYIVSKYKLVKSNNLNLLPWKTDDRKLSSEQQTLSPCIGIGKQLLHQWFFFARVILFDSCLPVHQILLFFISFLRYFCVVPFWLSYWSDLRSDTDLLLKLKTYLVNIWTWMASLLNGK